MPERMTRPFPWFPLFVLMLGIALFWVLPATVPNPGVTVQMAESGK